MRRIFQILCAVGLGLVGALAARSFLGLGGWWLMGVVAVSAVAGWFIPSMFTRATGSGGGTGSHGPTFTQVFVRILPWATAFTVAFFLSSRNFQFIEDGIGVNGLRYLVWGICVALSFVFTQAILGSTGSPWRSVSILAVCLLLLFGLAKLDLLTTASGSRFQHWIATLSGKVEDPMGPIASEVQKVKQDNQRIVTKEFKKLTLSATLKQVQSEPAWGPGSGKSLQEQVLEAKMRMEQAKAIAADATATNQEIAVP